MAGSRTPTFPEVLDKWRRGVLKELRVALPASVQRYDSDKQVVDVQPLIRELLEQPDGSTESADLPVICNVPVIFPGAGGYHITFPIQKGDTVLIVFADRSIDGWQDQGGTGDPTDARRHHLSDAIAIPGLHPNNAAIQSIETGVLALGQDGASSDWVALATSVKNEIKAVRDTLNSFVSTYNSHTHSVSGIATSGTALAQSQTAPVDSAAPSSTASAPAAVNDVKSATVKILG